MVTEETYYHTRKSETNIPVFLYPGITSKFGLSQHKCTVHDDIVLVCDVKGCLLTGSAKEQIKAHKDQYTTCRSWGAPLLAQLSEYPICMEFIILTCTQIVHCWNQWQIMVLQHMYHLRTYHIIGHCDSYQLPLVISLKYNGLIPDVGKPNWDMIDLLVDMIATAESTRKLIALFDFPWLLNGSWILFMHDWHQEQLLLSVLVDSIFQYKTHFVCSWISPTRFNRSSFEAGSAAVLQM